ncbi:MAG: acyltransferase [Anaerolineales bacterium]|nr:acyltransferase [Anaerolineales bacterium]
MKIIFLRGIKGIFNARKKRRDIQIGSGSTLAESFSLDNRGSSEMLRLIVGAESYLGGKIFLERESGQVVIGDRTYVGAGTNIICANNVQIGSDVLISWGVTIVDHDSHSLNWQDRADDLKKWQAGLQAGGLLRAAQLKNWDVVPSAPIVIEDKAWIGFNAILLKGIRIGEGAVIAAGAVITKDVPPFMVAAGNPARMVRELRQDER